jgi:hypothetical protein
MATFNLPGKGTPDWDVALNGTLTYLNDEQNKKYVKPTIGIPQSDLSDAVKTILNDSASITYVQGEIDSATEGLTPIEVVPTDADVSAYPEGTVVLVEGGIKYTTGSALSQGDIPRVIRHDTAANWLAANPILQAGEVVAESDTGSLRVGNGTASYSNLPVVVTANATTGALMGPVLDYLKKSFMWADSRNVSAGSVGFTPANPNVSLLNALITSVNALGGGTVIIPAGEYIIDNQVALVGVSNIHLRGDHAGSSKLAMKNGVSSRIGNLRGTRLRISNLWFDGGTGTENLALRAGGLVCEGLTDSFITNCRFSNIGQPVRIVNYGATISSDIRVLDSIFEATIRDHAIRAVEGAPARIVAKNNIIHNVLNGGANGETAAFRVGGPDHLYEGNMVLASYDTGIMFATGAYNCKSINNTYRTMQVSVFMGSSSKYCQSIGDTTYSSHDHCYHLYNPDDYADSLNGHVIANGVIEGAGKTGIYLEGSIRNRIYGMLIKDCGQTTQDPTGRVYDSYERSGITVASTIGGRTSTRNMITGNIIFDSRSGTARTMQWGIHILTGVQDYIVEKDNQIENTVLGMVNMSAFNSSSVGFNIETSGTKTYTTRPTPVARFTTAARPAADAQAPAMYYDTTLGVLCYSAGAVWKRVDTGATV